MLCAEDRIDTAFFSYGPGSLDAMIHNDHLGTPQKLTNSTGTVVWSADYKPFGEATITVSTITNNLRFPGQYFDSETGLNYNYYRDYNPAIGRYIESDPIGIQRGTNHLFSYAGQDPINSMDALGLACGSGWKQIFIPDNWFGWYSFEGPCSSHDSCYGCNGASAKKLKGDCDNQFYQDMMSECSKLKKGSYWRNHCEGTAGLYYDKVVNKGQPYFDAARKDCCKK